MARRRKRRRINKGRVAALLIIILVIAAGIFFVTTRFGRTSYASVNKSMGEYMVKANDDLLGKGTDKELKKSLYVPRKIACKIRKIIHPRILNGPLLCTRYFISFENGNRTDIAAIPIHITLGI